MENLKRNISLGGGELRLLFALLFNNKVRVHHCKTAKNVWLLQTRIEPDIANSKIQMRNIMQKKIKRKKEVEPRLFGNMVAPHRNNYIFQT